MATGISVSNKTRWLAAVTGCVTAVAGIPVLSFLPAVLSFFLIIGALLAGRFPRWAKGLIRFGALITSIWVIPLGLIMLHFSFTVGTDLIVTAAAAVSVLLVILCDATLVKEALDQRLRTND